ncbi:hypothetical protein [Bacillus sp. FJAT-49736]|uniref:hypothetical protein n=1 Tax=Bacillus sp. FJAT-49736 TaxID=2833582 RepID=UPI001BC9E769|nr:hypothetical protein [Bacillus sp. FJAT-49736]MBS4172824.1 hypothetical protein [Bacillus sp. FJAT-49736]
MLTNKAKYLLFYFFILIFLLSFTGCSENRGNGIRSVTFEGQTIIGVSISRVGESMLDIKKPHIFYTQKDTAEIQLFANAIKRAKKIDGVVDVTTPDYLLTLTFEDKTKSNYCLWIGKDGGSIMKEKDTHTMYILPHTIIKEMRKYVEKE